MWRNHLSAVALSTAVMYLILQIQTGTVNTQEPPLVLALLLAGWGVLYAAFFMLVALWDPYHLLTEHIIQGTVEESWTTPGVLRHPTLWILPLYGMAGWRTTHCVRVNGVEEQVTQEYAVGDYINVTQRRYAP